MSKFYNVASAAVAATVALTAVASASTYDDYVLRQNNASIYGSSSVNWSSSVSIKNGTDNTINTSAGPMRLKTRNSDNVWVDGFFFCTEITQYLKLRKISDSAIAANALPTNAYGDDYQESVRADLVGKTAKLGSLVSNFWDSIVDAKTGAAFQFAIWEIINETSADYNLTTGSFIGTTDNVDSLTLASEWATFAATGAGLPAVDVTYLHNGDSQDLITWDGETPAPVPVPGAALLLLTGLGAFGAMRRRG